MNAVTATRIGLAPSGWDFSMKLKIGFSYFHRFLANAAVVMAADVVSLLLSFQVAAILRSALFGQPMTPEWIWGFIFKWAIGSAVWGLLPGWGLSPVESLRRQVLLTCLTFGATAVVLFLSKATSEHSRFTLLLAFLTAVPMVPSLRMLAKRLLMRGGIWGVPVAVYGGGATGRDVIQRLKDEPGHGYYPVCIFDDDPDLVSQAISGVPVLGGTDSIARDVPLAILAMTRIDSVRISQLMEGPLSSYLRVVMVPNLIHAPSLWVTSRDLSGLPGLELSNNLLDPTKRVLKAGLEFGLTIATLPFWGPVCACIAGLIWLEDRGNPIFKQKRVGRGAMEFEVLKFRTMVPNAERVLEERLKNDPVLRAEWSETCKLRNDPRITRVGGFLRKTSLDELPQLLNVLKGEMSLVGPRPLPGYHLTQLPDSVRKIRERVNPGMTGLWQVSGRSDAGNAGMVIWDPYYVRNWSLWLDIVIIARTLRVVVLGSGAR